MDWDDMEREAAADDRKKKRDGEEVADPRPKRQSRRQTKNDLTKILVSMRCFCERMRYVSPGSTERFILHRLISHDIHPKDSAIAKEIKNEQ